MKSRVDWTNSNLSFRLEKTLFYTRIHRLIAACNPFILKLSCSFSKCQVEVIGERNRTKSAVLATMRNVSQNKFLFSFSHLPIWY